MNIGGNQNEDEEVIGIAAGGGDAAGPAAGDGGGGGDRGARQKNRPRGSQFPPSLNRFFRVDGGNVSESARVCEMSRTAAYTYIGLLEQNSTAIGN